ncbi:tRNA lysidine(34) synthetase TilS C-terminal domain-containing protein [Apilactobacillus ozensis]|uniref:tRNA lysidine(34) synthetase TilS C-terminal domain-containing protein n=1 Tax=Apilactobacillus ozensis TaxID=866801 RepID=UPI0006D0D5D8|nr:tRNA lysidine(34) synthetase TilS C-terminal domain-containing protein [Apilactobacillus ozensis]
MSEILNLLHNSRKPQAKINLINNTYLVKNYNVFRIECISDKNIDEVSKPFKLLINKWYKSVNGFSFGIFDDKFKFENVGSIDRQSTFYLSDKQLPLVVRQTNKNDKITLKSGGHQSAKRIFINKKILSIFRKRAQTLLTSDGKVLSIIGYSESTILNYSDKRYTLVVKGINLKGEEHE